MRCVINMDTIEVEKRNNYIFYAAKDFIIYKDNVNVVMDDCSGNRMVSIRCPADFRHFYALDLGDSVLLCLYGQDILIFDKQGSTPIYHRIDAHKIGRIVTKLFQSGENQMIFGSFLEGKVQIVNYDFMGQKRVSQSSSWQANSFDDLVVDNNIVYTLINRSTIVACDKNTCQSLWTRFEAGGALPKLSPYNDGVLYACQRKIRHRTENSTESFSLKLIDPQKIIGRNGNVVFCVHKNEYLIAYDLKARNILWELSGQSPIVDSLIIEGQRAGDTETSPVAVLMFEKYIGMVDLKLGQAIYHQRLGNIYQMSVGDNILIHDRNHDTYMVPTL